MNNNLLAWPNEDEYLVHHGIKGQLWGVRRYQNYDGTLTELGKQRYYKNRQDQSGGFTQKGAKAYNKAYGNMSSKMSLDLAFNDKKRNKATALLSENQRLSKRSALYSNEVTYKQLMKLYDNDKQFKKMIDAYRKENGDDVTDTENVQYFALKWLHQNGKDAWSKDEVKEYNQILDDLRKNEQEIMDYAKELIGRQRDLTYETLSVNGRDGIKMSERVFRDVVGNMLSPWNNLAFVTEVYPDERYYNKGVYSGTRRI